MRRPLRAPIVGLVSCVLAAAAPVAAQTGRITGIVTDSAGAQPIGAADVIVVGTRFRAATGSDGTYTIADVPPGTYIVEVRRIGYVAVRRTGVQVAEGGTVTLDFRLAPSLFRLQEVVVTGVLGETEGIKLPFTVGRIDAENAPISPTNALETIQGKIAGISVTPSGQPGSGTSIQLRTPTSISKSNFPLIAVDGVILGTEGGTSADLNGLDIERIEVVKGAAAASLYGSRAQAGVIQVWTRRGRDLQEGTTQYTLRSEFGVNSLAHKVRWARYHFYRMNAAQTSYVNAAGRDTTRDGRIEEALTGTLGPAGPEFRFQDNPYPTTVYDQVDAFFDPGQFMQSQLTIASKARRTNWYASATTYRSSGVLERHGDYRRNSMRLNLDHSLRDDLMLSLSGEYARSVRDELDGNTFFDLINIAPDVNLNQRDPDGTRYIFQPDPVGIRANPLYKNEAQSDWTSRGRFLGGATLRYTPAGWISIEGNLSYDRSERFNSFFLDRGLKSDQYQTGGPGFIEQHFEYADALNASASVTLNRQYGATSFRTQWRALIEREDNNTTDAEGEQLAVSGLPDLTNAAVRSVNSQYRDTRASGYFMIAGIEHDGKYILDGLVRRDGSSLFGSEERWHTYGRFSTAYRMAQEPWWPFENISEFKLRFSRGTAGGRPEFPDQYETYDVDEAGVLTKETLGNRFLKPERATETEVGLDVIALGALSVQLSYARTEVRDQLVLVPLSALFGYPSQWQNAGTIAGNTWEATVEAQLITRPGLSWRLGLVADRARHKITEFERPCFRTGVSYRCAGEPLGVMYGHHFLRHPSELPMPDSLWNRFAVNDDGLLVAVGLDSVGDPRSYRDMRWGTTVNVNGVNYNWGRPIRQLDQSGNPAIVKIGDSNADFHFGVSNRVTWKNLVFYGLVDVQVGGQVFNATKLRQYQWWRSGEEDQVGKPDSLKKPPAYYSSLYNGNDENDWFVEPGGFLKLRELSVSYRVPVDHVRFLRPLGIRGLYVSLVGRNLFTLTGYSGYDPEIRDDESNPIIRADDFDYPRFRTVTGSIQIEF